MKKVLVSVFGILFIAVIGVLAWKAFIPAGGMLNQAVATDILLQPTKLLVTQGQATVSRTGADPIKVTTDLDVKEGDAIKVETTGKATIQWPDGSVTRLGGGTDMTITKASIDKSTGKQEAEVDIRAGQAWTKVLNIVYDDSSMQVRAQNTVAGIRGTSVYTAVSATGVVMMPLEHGIEVQVGGIESREALLEGEGMVVKEGNMTRVASGTVMTSFVAENEKADEKYLEELGGKRRTKFMESLKKETSALPDRATFEKDFKNKQGTTDEKSRMLGTMLDRLVLEMMSAQDAKDTVRLAELTEYYEGLAPLLAEAAAADPQLRANLRQRVHMHMAVLFSDGVTDDTFLARQAVAKARIALLDPKDQTTLRRVLRKEMFFASDLAEEGKSRQVQEQLQMLKNQTNFQQPFMDGATKPEQDMMARMTQNMEAMAPSMTDGIESLRRQVYSTKTETNANVNQNANQNSMDEPVIEEPKENINVNTNTAARRNANTNAVKTNTNTNTAKKTNTNTNTLKPATTTVKPTTTTTTPTTTVQPTTTNTLVPAPVRVKPEVTSRPVTTPAR